MTESTEPEAPAVSSRGYLEQMSLEETDTRELIDSSDSDSSHSDSEHPDEAEEERPPKWRRRSTRRRPPPKWWFQHPSVKRNWLTVLGAWALLCLAILCILIGIVLEVLFHAASLDIFRGFILMIVGAVLLVPTVYVTLHIYLAAKRVGRVRMSSVWFFR